MLTNDGLENSQIFRWPGPAGLGRCNLLP